MTAEELAIACSDIMHGNDQTAKFLGIELKQSKPGFAELHMNIRKEMLNGHGACHGGMIFSLADTAFAHACNNANKMTVASGCSIDFVAPGFEGDTLIAIASERARGNRTGTYDIEVTNQKGDVIALFRGRSYQVKGQFIDE